MDTHILLDLEAHDREEAITHLSAVWEQAGIIKPGYGAAVIQREMEYPTGLPTEGVHVAIPHASAELVNSSALFFCRLKHPVLFGAMDSDTEMLEVPMIFMLALKDSAVHTDVLRGLMEIFQNSELLHSLYTSQDERELRTILTFDEE